MCPAVLHYFYITHPERHPEVLTEWDQITKTIKTLILEPAENVKIYQNSLPDVTPLGQESIDNVYPQDIAVAYLAEYIKMYRANKIPDVNLRILLGAATFRHESCGT